MSKYSYGNMSKKVIPPRIFCPKCGNPIDLVEDTSPGAMNKIKEQGYTAMAKGICPCGIVCVLCYQPLPASPTFSLFFDIYPPNVIKELLKAK